MGLVAEAAKSCFVQVIAVEVRPKDHVRERIPDCDVRWAAFSCAVFPDRLQPAILKVFARIEPAVALKIELESAGVEPVNYMSRLRGCDQLVHDDSAMVLDIAAISSNHTVETDVPDVRVDFCFAAVGAYVDPVTACTRPADCSYGGFGKICLIVYECSVNIDEKNFAHHGVLSKLCYI